LADSITTTLEFRFSVHTRLPSSACALSLFRWRLKDKRRGRMRPNVVNHHLLAAAVL